MGSLFRVRGEDEERGVVFLREEFETAGVFEGVDGVFLGEADGEGPFERLQVRHEVAEQVGGAGAFEEECRFGVFVRLGLALLEGALGAGVLGLAGTVVSLAFPMIEEGDERTFDAALPL